jgi:hypothetical protein
MFAMFVMAIPCVNVVMIIIWAFAGENESRKNYFRALIVWFLFWVAAALVLLALGLWPQILKHLQNLKP